MFPHRIQRTLQRLAFGCLLAANCLGGIGASPRAILATASTYFASTNGSGTTCSQSQPCSLQTAIGKAGDGDTIYAAGGTYTGTGEEVAALVHSVRLYGGWNGASSGPVVKDPTVHVTTLDGQNQRRVVSMTGAITPVLDGFRITRGNAANATTEPGSGGGIYSNGAAPTITNNQIVNNTANAGASVGYGGGIYLGNAFSPTSIESNLISGNIANTDPNQGGLGGGMHVYCQGSGEVTIAANTIRDNVGGETANSHGGGLYLYYASANVHDNLIQDNLAGRNSKGFGGALFHQFGSLTFSSNYVIGNAAEYGTLTFLQNEFELDNNVVASNVGGGVFARGTLTQPAVGILAHNTIVQNGSRGVFLGWYNSGHVTLTLVNNIIAGHTTGIEATIDADNSNIANAYYTLFYGNTNDTAGSNISNTHAITSNDPRLVSMGERLYHLGCGSPAMDAGTPGAGILVDIDGDPRNDGAPDIGADEFSATCMYLPSIFKK